MKFAGSFGDWLRQRRKALDLTQHDLADQVGCAEVTIRRIEGNVGRPSKQIAERMADALAISLDERATFVSFARGRDRLQTLPVDSTSQLRTCNLPPQSTPFIGRERELAQIADYFADPACRLLTLLGPGGIGKTRLALQAASHQLDQFANGVYFVPLTPVGSSGFIAAAIASAFQTSFYGQDDPNAQVVNMLHDKHVLLLMDNYDHLLGGVGLLTDILAQAPRIKILATSRERLNIQEEWAFPVEGLPFPTRSADDLFGSYSAVQLFMQSARRTQPGFALEGNQQAVIDICQAVEGMPLGLELAASWLRGMSCQQIAAEMGSNLDFLSTPLRNVPERHRSLRLVFEQSWKLLSAAEQDALMRLSVFHGSFDLEAAERVAGASLLLLVGLTDKSLIRLGPAGRYDLHELLRQYAGNQLRDAGLESLTIQRHFDYFLKLAEVAEAHAFGHEQVAWFDRLQADLDNVRAALAWSAETVRGLQLATALTWFFAERSYWNEGHEWVGRTLAANPNAPVFLRAKALQGAGALGRQQETRMLCEQALELARGTNDRWNLAWSLSHLAFAEEQAPLEVAAFLDESLRLFRELGDPMGIVHTLLRRAWFPQPSDPDGYQRLLVEEAEARACEAGDKITEGWAAYHRGKITWTDDHNVEQARVHLEHSAALFRDAHCLFNQPYLLLAEIELAAGNIIHAEALHQKRLILLQETRPTDPSVFSHIAGLACVAIARGQFERAARLLGAADREGPYHDVPYSSYVERLRHDFGEANFTRASAAGKAMTRQAAIAYALEDETVSPLDN